MTIGLLVFLATGLSPAQQDPAARAQPPLPAASAPLKQKVVFALATDATLKQSQIVEILDLARDYGKERNLSWAKPPAPRPITGETYRLLESFVRPGGEGITSLIEGGGGTGPRLDPFPGTPIWLIDLGDPRRNLIEIGFQDAAGKTLDNPARTDKDDPRLEFVTLGKWKFTPNFETPPKKYTLKFKEKGKEQTETKDWPIAADGYWLIELPDFVGSPQDLFTVLEEGDYPTAIKQVIGKSSTTLVLTDLREGVTDLESDFNGATFFFRFPLVRKDKGKTAVEKMYVLFPLTKDQATATVKNIEGKSAKEVIELVLSSNPSLAADTPKLSPNVDARWYEIPQVIGGYERAIPVDDIQGWKAAATGTGAEKNWRVTVYQLAQTPAKEGAPKKTPLAFRVRHPDRGGGGVLAVDQVEKKWIAGLRQLQVVPEKKP